MFSLSQVIANSLSVTAVEYGSILLFKTFFFNHFSLLFTMKCNQPNINDHPIISDDNYFLLVEKVVVTTVAEYLEF